jgi:hypothetical protein
VAIMTAIATPLGPYTLYCQLLATRATWRWGFWITWYAACPGINFLSTDSSDPAFTRVLRSPGSHCSTFPPNTRDL